MDFNIAVINGDGIGEEIMAETIKVLKRVEKKYNHVFNFNNLPGAGEAVDKMGAPMPEEVSFICQNCHGTIVGNVGGKKWDNNPLELNPVRAVLQLRKKLDATINLRPIYLKKQLFKLSPLKEEVLKDGIDIIMVRDIMGGMICSKRLTDDGFYGREASDIEYYNESIVRNIAKMGFELAMKRRKKVASIDKANVLASSKLWRTVVNEVAKQYPEVQVEHYLVDNAAMEVIKDPSHFDIIIASNIFGDIMADEISQITGVPDMLGSAEISADGKGIYTPNQLHNPNENIIGKNIANPIGLISAAVLMLRHSLKLDREAMDVEEAINKVIEAGYATEDIFVEGKTLVSTEEMGTLIANAIN